MPAMFKANERCYKRIFGLYGFEALNNRLELKILWDRFRLPITKLWFPYDCRISNDRRWSQTIVDDRTWFYLLRSSVITIVGSQAIAEVCFHMIADDRRTFCDLRSAIVCDHMETSLKEFNKTIIPFALVGYETGYSQLGATRPVGYNARSWNNC